MTSPISISSILVGVQATTSPSIRVGLIDSDVTRSIGKGVPAQTDRNRAKIKNKADMNKRLPIIDLKRNLMRHPILFASQLCK